MASASVRQPSFSKSESTSELNSDPVSEELRALHKRIIELATSVHSINIQAFEELTPEKIRTEFAPLVIESLKTALSLTGQLLEEFDQSAQNTDSRESFNVEIERIVDVVANNTLSTGALSYTKLADIAFISSIELTTHSKKLGQLRDGLTSWELIAAYSSALRGITKTMSAIEFILCDIHSCPERLNFQTQLEYSQRSRRAYLHLRRVFLKQGAPSEQTIYAHMRSAGTQIAVLIGQDIYPHLRVEDRAQLREIQHKILNWLRDEEVGPLVGIRLWQDMAGVLDIFCQISRRQELVEHDGNTVETIYDKLCKATDDEVDSHSHGEVLSLEGLDPELDGLLYTSSPPKVSELVLPLERLMVHFGKKEVATGGMGTSSGLDFF